jgi:hypothetical protein
LAPCFGEIDVYGWSPTFGYPAFKDFPRSRWEANQLPKLEMFFFLFQLVGGKLSDPKKLLFSPKYHRVSQQGKFYLLAP